jgi:putative addiction module killer protein
MEVNIYETLDGKVPFSEWLTSLRDLQAAARILLRIDRVKQGNLGDHKFIDDGIFELRIDVGAGYRVYFARLESQEILILWGGDKSSQTRDIEKARKFWLDCRNR